MTELLRAVVWRHVLNAVCVTPGVYIDHPSAEHGTRRRLETFPNAVSKYDQRHRLTAGRLLWVNFSKARRLSRRYLEPSNQNRECRRKHKNSIPKYIATKVNGILSNCSAMFAIGEQ